MDMKFFHVAVLFILNQANFCGSLDNLDSNGLIDNNPALKKNPDQGFLLELEVSLESTLISCKENLEQVTEKLLKLLQESDDIEDFPWKVFPEDSFLKLGNPDSANALDEEFDFIRDFQMPSLHKPAYANDFQSLLDTLEDACLSLPTALPSPHSRSPRSTEGVSENVKTSVALWMARWVPPLERRMDSFLDSCLSSPDCNSSLEQLLEGTLSIVESGSLKGFHSLFKEDPHSINELPQNGVSLEALSKLQRLALKLEDQITVENGQEGSFWIAANLNKKLHPLQDEDVFSNGAHSVDSLMQIKGELELETSYLSAEVPETFLSVALGSRIIQEGWKKLPKKLDKFLSLASYLSPAMLRMGGSAANFLHYDSTAVEPIVKGGRRDSNWPIFHPKLNGNSEKNTIHQPDVFYHPKFNMPRKNELTSADTCEPQYVPETNYAPFTNFTMKAYDWHFLVNITKHLGWDLLFDLNQFARDAQGNWDPTNARELLQEAATSSVPIIWQLGNEPNAYMHKFHFNLPPEQGAEDYKQLRDLMNENGNGERMKLVGPDVTRPKHLKDLLEGNELEEDSVKYLTEFVEDFRDLDAITWHQYYINGRDATLSDFTSTKLMDDFPPEVERIVSIRDQTSPQKPIWITETATAWGGGAPGLSDSFAGTFLWLDKLGAAALGGISSVFRQTFYGGCYAILDPEELEPTPEYWVSVLHKKTTGRGVVLPRARLLSKNTRLYSHCLNGRHPLYEKGSAVVFGMNVGKDLEVISLYGDDLKTSPLFVYRLSSYPQSDLTAKKVALNGLPLEATPEGTLPDLLPEQKPHGTIEFYPGEIAFWIIPKANLSLC